MAFTTNIGGQKSSLQGFATNINSNDSTKLTKQGLESKSSTKSAAELEQFSSNEIKTGKLQTASNIENLVKVANDAIEEVERIRTAQLGIYEEILDSSLLGHSTELFEELDSLDSELTRVVTEATYNGINVLQSGSTIATDFAEYDKHGAISLANPSSAIYQIQYLSAKLLPDESIRLESEQNLSSVRSLKAGFAAAAGKAERTPFSEAEEAARTKASENSQTVTDPKEAKELAIEIANKISSPFATEAAKLQIIETSSAGLDPSRVSKLLEPG